MSDAQFGVLCLAGVIFLLFTGRGLWWILTARDVNPYEEP